MAAALAWQRPVTRNSDIRSARPWHLSCPCHRDLPATSRRCGCRPYCLVAEGRRELKLDAQTRTPVQLFSLASVRPLPSDPGDLEALRLPDSTHRLRTQTHARLLSLASERSLPSDPGDLEALRLSSLLRGVSGERERCLGGGDADLDGERPLDGEGDLLFLEGEGERPLEGVRDLDLDREGEASSNHFHPKNLKSPLLA